MDRQQVVVRWYMKAIRMLASQGAPTESTYNNDHNPMATRVLRFIVEHPRQQGSKTRTAGHARNSQQRRPRREQRSTKSCKRKAPILLRNHNRQLVKVTSSCKEVSYKLLA